MSAFTTESLVREQFHLLDTVLVSSDMIVMSIDNAHAELLRFLDTETVTDPPEAALVMGETILAGAYLYRTLAANDAFSQKRLALGDQRVEEGIRFQSLLAIAEISERQAWYLLEPYLLSQPTRDAVSITDTTPVLGEE